MLSMYEIKRILHSEQVNEPIDDLRIIDSWTEYESGSEKDPANKRLAYLCYEIEVMDPNTGDRTRCYKAIRFARVRRLPGDAKQSLAFMDMQQQVLTGIWENGYNFITIIANIIKPEPIGLLFLYGIQGVSESLSQAKKIAHNNFLGFIAMMQGTFRVLEMECLKAKEAEWLREKMYNMDYMTVIRGIPKANKSGENMGNKGMGDANLNPNSQGTLEELITGMADYEYVVEILSTPVRSKTLEGWQYISQKEMTDWYGQLQGTKGISMNLSIPMMYMANVSNSQGWSKAYTDSDTVSYSQGESYSEGMSQTAGRSFSQNYGTTVGHTHGQSSSMSLSNGITRSKGVSYGETLGESYGTNQSVSHGTNRGINQGMSVGQGENAGISANKNFNQSQNLGVSQNQSIGHSKNVGLSRNESFGLSQGESLTNSRGHSEGSSYGMSQGHSEGTSENVGRSHSFGINQSQSSSIGNSASYSQSSSKSIGSSYNESFGNSQSQGGSYSHNAGESHGTSFSRGSSGSYNHGESHNESKTNSFGGNVGGEFFITGGVNGSHGTNTGNGYSDSWGSGHSTSSGRNDGYSVSDSYGQNWNSGYSHSQSVGGSSSVSQGQSTSIGSSMSRSSSFGQSESIGTTESYGASHSDSISQNWGANASDSLSQSIGQSIGKSSSYGNGMSIGLGDTSSIGSGISAGSGLSQGMGEGMSRGQSTNQGLSQGMSYGESDSVSTGSSYGLSHSKSMSQSESLSQSQTLGQSLGQTTSESLSQSASNGIGQSISQGQSVSNGQSFSNSTGSSKGTSSGTSGTTSMGTSSSMGLGPSIGFTKSYQWLDQGVKDLLELLEFQNERIKKAMRGEGAFYTYVYIACPSMDALSAAQAIAKSTWQNSDAMIQPLQVLKLTETEQKHLLYHFAAFSVDVTRENVFGAEEYKYCTVLLPDEFVSYTHLPRVSEGGVTAIVQDIPKFSVPSGLTGEIYLGTVLNSERFTFKNGYRTKFEYRIDESALIHGFFTGASRSGKTVAAMRFISELAHVRRKKTGKGIRIVVMDPKQDWRGLARYVEPERFNFHSMGNVNFEPIKLNPWKIPYGVWPQIWIDGVIDIYCRSYGLLERGKQMIADVVYELYNEEGVFEACNYDDWKVEVPKRSANVTFADIYQKMFDKKASLEDPNNKGGRAGNDTRDAYARLLDRLSCFNRSYGIEYQLYGTREGVGIDDLIGGEAEFKTEECRKNNPNLYNMGMVTVLESKGLENTFKNFIFGVVTSGFYKYALAHEGGFLAEDQHETVLVIEEANEVLIGNDTAGGGDSVSLSGESEFEQILDQSAGYGLFIFSITQKIADMPSSVIANSGLVFSGRLARPDDVTTVVRAVGREERIDDRDLVKWFPRAPIGWFICKSARGFDFKEAEPVLVQIAMLNVSTPSNMELKELLAQKKINKLLKAS